MKLICSLLIFAGVFALNDAFPSFDDQMRLANDKLILEDLKRITANRDSTSSAACSGKYLTGLTECLNTYNSDLAICEDATQVTIAALNKDAKEKVEEFNSNITSSCKSDCSTLPSPSDALDCIDQESSANSRMLIGMSVSASTISIELAKGIANAQGIKDVCDQKCYSDYSSKSQEVEEAFKKCVNQKDQ